MPAGLIAVPPPAQALGPIEDALNRYHACTLAAQAMMLTQPVPGTIEMGWCQVDLVEDAYKIADDCFRNLCPPRDYFWIGETLNNPEDGDIYIPTQPPAGQPGLGWATRNWGGYKVDAICW